MLNPDLVDLKKFVCDTDSFPCHSHSALCNVYPVSLHTTKVKVWQFHYDHDYACLPQGLKIQGNTQ
jgi:hypothetical protein